MSFFSERLEQHPIKDTITNIEEALAPYSSSDMDVRSAEIVLRTKKLLICLRQYLDDLDPELMPSTTLADLQQALGTLVTAISQSIDSGQWDELVTGGDLLAQCFTSVPRATAPSADKKYRKILKEYRTYALDIIAKDNRTCKSHVSEIFSAANVLEEKLTNIESASASAGAQVESLLGKIGEVATSLDQKSSEVMTLLTECQATIAREKAAITEQLALQTQQHETRLRDVLTQHESSFAEAQLQRATEFSTKADQRASDHSTAEIQFREEFSNLQNLRATEFSRDQESRVSTFEASRRTWEDKVKAVLSESRTEFDGSIQGFQQSCDSLIHQYDSKMKGACELQEQNGNVAFQKFTEQSADCVKKLKEYKAQAKNLVGIIGNVGVTGNYQKIANREWWSAEIFRGISLLFLAFLMYLVGYVVLRVDVNGLNWEAELFRIGIGLAIVGPALYCAHESSRHRRNEERNRRIELELASLGPYLENLSEDKAREVRETLAPLYFAAESTAKESSVLRDAKDLKVDDLLKALEPIIKFYKAVK